MLHSVVFTGSDYGKLTQIWWKQWHPAGIAQGLLSQRGIAVLGSKGPVAIGHLFPLEGSEMCALAWVVGNPNLSKFRIGRALKLLIKAAEDEALRLGYPILYVQSESTAVHKICARTNFNAGDFLQIYIKRLI